MPFRNFDDTLQTYRLIAIKAAKKYDPKRGIPFVSWATYKTEKEYFKSFELKQMYKREYEDMESVCEFTYSDTINDTATTEYEVATLLSLLPLTDQQLLRDYYGIGTKKLNDKGLTIKYGCSRATVGRKRREAINQIKLVFVPTNSLRRAK